MLLAFAAKGQIGDVWRSRSAVRSASWAMTAVKQDSIEADSLVHGSLLWVKGWSIIGLRCRGARHVVAACLL